MMQSLDAPASLLSLSQSSSDIRFGDRNPAVLRTTMQSADSEINIQLEQLVTHLNAILFQLFYRSNIYRSVCLCL